MKQRGFFDENDRLREISKLGDPLERLNAVIDWEFFRPQIAAVCKKEAKGPGGRPPYDYVVMFKILVLQRLYGISDAQTEFQIKDRLSFMRFLGFSLCDTVPDEKTIWLFREQLVKANIMDTLFYGFTSQLEQQGLITRMGSMIDASFVKVPKQRNTKAEVHDSQLVRELVDKEKDKVIYADSAYKGKEIESCLGRNIENQICEKGYRNKPLTEEQKAMNGKRSSVRVRIEHVFGFMTNSMKGMMIRCMGIARARFAIGMMNLVYNMCRYGFLVRARA